MIGATVIAADAVLARRKRHEEAAQQVHALAQAVLADDPLVSRLHPEKLLAAVDDGGVSSANVQDLDGVAVRADELADRAATAGEGDEAKRLREGAARLRLLGQAAARELENQGDLASAWEYLKDEFV